MKKQPLFIAGPCSVESEEQVNAVAQELSGSSISILRGGIWKPRTRPDSFEGLGEVALPWLVSAAKNAGLKSTTEVANAKHVELALEAGIDVLWIGARTTVNPFAVQEIADAIKGLKIPVMVKNPINPDLELWIGAFERLEKVGITELYGIHRGFSIYKHPKYRNVPQWEIPIALKERLPELPIICDPSHITGDRALLQEVSQKALDLNFDGLMIETHPNPDKALSDPKQQITPQVLLGLIDRLILRSSKIDASTEEQLRQLREKMIALDDRIFDILAERMRESEKIGTFKRENNITILQQEHWEKMIRQRLAQAQTTQLSTDFIRQLMDAIHLESIRHQMKIMNH